MTSDESEPPGRADPEDLDDLVGVETAMSRFAGRWGRVLAAVLALVLVVSLGGRLLDELAFGVSGRALEAEVGDTTLTDAVLLVRSVDCAGRVSTGSGFALVVDGRALVVTNRHVVADARATSVRPLDGGSAAQVTAHRVATSADVAVLELAPDDVPPALVAGQPAGVGDEVRTVGFPRATPSTTTGSVVAAGGGLLELDLVVDPGASGSPVTDDAGAVVGQVFARTADGRGLATGVVELVTAAGAARPADDC